MIATEELQTRTLSVPDRARSLAIVTAADYVAAGELLKVIKGLRAEIGETFDPIISKAHEVHKEAIDQKRRVDAPLCEAEGILKPRIARYLQEQERLRQEEELRLRKIEQEEAERRQLEEAVALDAIGETTLANEILDAPIVPIPVVAPRTVPKVQGIAMTTRYSASVTNLMDLVRAVAAGRAPIQCLKADDVFLNQQARAMKEALSYPGVRLNKESGISARR